MADKLVTQVSQEDAKKQKQGQTRQESSCWDLCCGCFSGKKNQSGQSAAAAPAASRPAATAATAGAATGDDDVPAGLLPVLKADQAGIKTLVLDLDETLVHSSFQPVMGADLRITITLDGEEYEVYVSKRPGVDEFLQHCKDSGWEIIIFTASLALYADPVLDRLDTNRVSSFRLFRESCTLHYGNFVKDLTRLGRKLKHTVIVDNSPLSYMFQPDNAIPITSWFSDKSDTELYNLCPLLDVLIKADDLGQELGKYKPLDLSIPFVPK
jgi:RNA polymerase II subunit A small phosphatase-like protein